MPSSEGSFFRIRGAVRRMVSHEAQTETTGQWSQRGALAVQMVAPRSMRAWFQSYALAGGRSDSAASHTFFSSSRDEMDSIFQRMRERTRRTFTSTTGTLLPKAN